MTNKQKRFVEEYLIDLNATQAAIRAGYRVSKTKSASEIGAQLLKNTQVSAAIEKAMAERSRRTGINQDRVLNELARIAFVNPKNVIDPKDASVRANASDDDLASIQSIKVKMMDGEKGTSVEREVKLNDKLKALEMIGRHLGIWNDKVDINGTIPVVISGEENLEE